MIEYSKLYEKIGNYYDVLVKRHGHNHRACDYGRYESQIEKYRVLSEVMPLNGKSVLDVGCGFGDYVDYLNDKYINVRYTGVDISKVMVEEARRLHPEKDIRQLNILDKNPGKYDLVTANGIFYLLGDDAPVLTKILVERMYELANHAVAFNCLSSWAKDKEKGEYYADPLEVLDLCLSITQRIVLRHDYHPRDFAIYLYKD